MRYVDWLLAGSGWNWFFVVLMMEYWSGFRWDVTYYISCRSAGTSCGCARLCVALVTSPHKCAGNHQLLINTMWPCITVVQGHVVLISSWLPAHLWGVITRATHKRAQPHDVPADLQLTQYVTSHLNTDQYSIINTTKIQFHPDPASSQST